MILAAELDSRIRGNDNGKGIAASGFVVSPVRRVVASPTLPFAHSPPRTSTLLHFCTSTHLHYSLLLTSYSLFTFHYSLFTFPFSLPFSSTLHRAYLPLVLIAGVSRRRVRGFLRARLVLFRRRRLWLSPRRLACRSL